MTIEPMQTVTLRGTTNRHRQLIVDHGVTWMVVDAPWNMPCFNGDLGVSISTLDGTHCRNVRLSDIG